MEIPEVWKGGGNLALADCSRQLGSADDSGEGRSCRPSDNG